MLALLIATNTTAVSRDDAVYQTDTATQFVEPRVDLYGNEISETGFKFTGVMKNGEIELTRERQEIRNAGNAGAGYSRPGGLTFKIKRLP